ncbi:MAG: metallophosphoesterase family protein [Clostridia bacterium]|nr:metallophosphoesterase family protein [Clostridia bacterium]
MQEFVKPVRGSADMPDHIMLSLRGDAATSMTVTWRTRCENTSGYVLYRAEGETQYCRCDADTDFFFSDIDRSSMFWAHLENLKPDTKYYYTCGNDDFRSAEFHFTTAPKNLTKFKFICVSDQQKGDPHDCPDYSWFNGFLKRILKAHPDTRFILTGGDNTDCGQHEVQWNGAFSGLVGVTESVPFMMTLGNHDNRGFADYAKGIGRYYSEPAEFFGKQFKGSYPDNGPENWKTENYTFDYGNVHFAVLGVNGPEEVNEWMIRDLSATRQTWKIGTYHFPICYSGSNLQNYDAYPVMREGFEMLDLVFSGHEHNFARSFPLRGEELHAEPSKGTVHYMLGNSNQNPPGTRSVPKIWHSAFYTQEEQGAMVCIVEVDGSKMTLTAMMDDGRIADRCVIDKEKDEIQPYALPPRFNRTRLMYRGMDPGIMTAATPCCEKDGVWFVPMATLIAYAGGSAVKSAGRIDLELYGRTACFTEGSDIAVTDRGEMKLPAPVFRGEREQLYVPADGCHAFDMRWAYAPYNNFLSFEHESEDRPVTIQP